MKDPQSPKIRNLALDFLIALANSDPAANPRNLSSKGILIAFCLFRVWGYDTLMRLLEFKPVTDWKRQFEELEVKLHGVTKQSLNDLALKTQDGTSALLLATVLDGLKILALEIEKRLNKLEIAKRYIAFRDTEGAGELDQLVKIVSPEKLYYFIANESPEERRSDIVHAFLEFLKKKTSLDFSTNEADFPHSILKDHLPAPTEWDREAARFLKEEIEKTIRTEMAVLAGELETAPLQVRTALRAKYQKWCPEITFGTTGQVVTPKKLDLEKIDSGKMRELGNSLNPEILLGEKEDTESLERRLRSFAKCDSALFWALMKNEGNKAKAAAELGISRPTLYERLKKALG